MTGGNVREDVVLKRLPVRWTKKFSRFSRSYKIVRSSSWDGFDQVFVKPSLLHYKCLVEYIRLYAPLNTTVDGSTYPWLKTSRFGFQEMFLRKEWSSLTSGTGGAGAIYTWKNPNTSSHKVLTHTITTTIFSAHSLQSAACDEDRTLGTCHQSLVRILLHKS